MLVSSAPGLDSIVISQEDDFKIIAKVGKEIIDFE